MDGLRREACGCLFRLVTDKSGERGWDQIHVCTEHGRERARRHLAAAREVLGRSGATT